MPARDRSGPSFVDRCALVTGGAGGIGGAIVRALADRGARVAAVDLEPVPGAECSLQADLTDESATADAVAGAARALGGLELLVCAAGVVSEAPLEQLSVREWRRVVDSSLTATFMVLKAAIPYLRAAETASVCAISSGWARRPYPRGAHYAAGKAGIEALVRAAATELAPDGIRVNAVAPGPIRTPMLDDLPAFDERVRAEAIPLGRIGEPSDVVGPILFLLAPASGYMTGQVLGVSGGLVMP